MLYLFLATFFWGSTFIVQRSAAENIDPFLFNGIRFFIAGLILFIFCSFFKVKISWSLLKHASFCGALVMLAINLQQVGILYTSAGKAGVITSLYLLFIPIFLLIEGRLIKLKEYLLLFVSLFGFYLLSEIDSHDLNKGDFLILVSAIIFSIHVIAIDKYTNKYNPFIFSSIQFLACGILSLLVSSYSASSFIKPIQSTYFEILYACLISVLCGYTLQVIGQRKTQSHTAGFIMSLEGPIALVLGSLILNEIHTNLQNIGASIIAISAILVSIESGKKVEKPTNSLQ